MSGELQKCKAMSDAFETRSDAFETRSDAFEIRKRKMHGAIPYFQITSLFIKTARPVVLATSPRIYIRFPLNLKTK